MGGSTVGASTPAPLPGMGKTPLAAANFSPPHRRLLWGKKFLFGEEIGYQPQCITVRRAHTHAHGSHTRVHAHGLPRGGARRPGPLLRETGARVAFQCKPGGNNEVCF